MYFEILQLELQEYVFPISILSQKVGIKNTGWRSWILKKFFLLSKACEHLNREFSDHDVRLPIYSLLRAIRSRSVHPSPLRNLLLF